MAYKRKGGKGLGGNSGKTPSLRVQFNYYKKSMERQFARERHMDMATGHAHVDEEKMMSAWITDFDVLMTKGVVKNLADGSRKRLVGKEAVEYQMEAMRKRGSKSHQAELFLNNYESALRKVETPEKDIKMIMNDLRAMPINKLTVALRTGNIKDITFNYAEKEKAAKKVREWNASRRENLNRRYDIVKEKIKRHADFDKFVKQKYGG